MKSCLEKEDNSGLWNARTWYVVKKADIQRSEDNVLVPSVEMGVEAREQIQGKGGLEDAPITRAGHPLVKYAEKFTENFDLIAERKSAIYHLRELAKATLLAKFITDAKVPLDDVWFSLADEDVAPCVMEIPQLWNERVHSEIQVNGGKILSGRASMSNVYGLYGGVELAVPELG